MAAKRKRKSAKRTSKKRTAKRKTKKAKHKGHVPLAILKRRLAKLTRIVKSRS